MNGDDVKREGSDPISERVTAHGERLAAIEAHLQHMATRSWVLGGVVGGMVAAATITLAVIKLFGG